MGALATLANSIHTELDAGATPHEVGAEHLHTPKAPPYVVWVHQGVGHEAGSTHAGPRQDGANQVSKACLTRHLTVDVHVWAATADAAETLIEGLIAAAYNVASGSVGFGGEKWPKQAAHEHLERGEPVILRLLLAVPVVAWTQETAEMTGGNDPDTDWVEEL